MTASSAKRQTVVTLALSLAVALALFCLAVTHGSETIGQIAAFVDGVAYPLPSTSASTSTTSGAFPASDGRTRLPPNCAQHDSELVTVTVLPPLTEARARAAMEAACVANRLQDDVCEAAGTALRQRVAAAAAAAAAEAASSAAVKRLLDYAGDTVRGRGGRGEGTDDDDQDGTCTGGAEHTSTSAEAGAASTSGGHAASDTAGEQVVTLPFRVDHSVQQGISINGDTHHLRLAPSTDVAELARETCAQHAVESKDCARLVAALRDKQRDAFCTPTPSASADADATSGASEQLPVEGSW